MAKRDPRTGELLTTNYSWTKPTVGSSVDAWGGYVNADLDAIDSVVHGIQTSVPAASTTTPAMNGTAAVGTGTTWARADHVHPTDVRIIGDSRIINGDMGRDQRNNGASGTALNAFPADRWFYNSTQAGKITWQRAGVGAPGFPYAVSLLSNSAFAVAASDYCIFAQNIEADMVSDFQWGSANAQSVTLSFWAATALVTGTFSGVVSNYAGTRAYPFTFSIPATGVWTKIAITIPGDTAGTWVMSGNGGGVIIRFDIGSGATWRAPAGAWASGNFVGANGSVSVVGTNAAVLYLTGVKLEIGSVATPFNRQSVAKSLADCQRYYQTNTVAMNAGGITGQPIGYKQLFITEMRGPPTVVYSQFTGDNITGTTSSNSTTAQGLWTVATVTTTGYAWFSSTWTADAEL